MSQPFKPSLGFRNFLNRKTVPLTKIKGNWGTSVTSTTLTPLPSLQEGIVAAPEQPCIPLPSLQEEMVASSEQPRKPKVVIDSDTSSSDSDSESKEWETEKELDTVEHAMDTLIQLYVDQSAEAIVLSGRDLSEQVLHVNELVKEYDVEEMQAGADETKRLYDRWWNTITECLGGIEELKEFNEKNLLAKVAVFSKQRTKTPVAAAEAGVIATKTSKKRKRKKSSLEKGQPVKYAKKGPYSDDEIEFMMNCQVNHRFFLLAAEDDNGDYFDMTDVIKIMSIELERPAYGITKRLRVGKLRLKDNEHADPVLIKKMKAEKIYPWPRPAQRARMLHAILKRRKKKT